MNQVTKKPEPGALASKLRVTKKLATTNRGAIKLAQQWGESLVCVRHRTQSKMVHIRVNPKEYSLKNVVRAAGAVWDSKVGHWRIPKRVATVLRLTGRIVQSR
jgi:hypothetical protein